MLVNLESAYTFIQSIDLSNYNVPNDIILLTRSQLAKSSKSLSNSPLKNEVNQGLNYYGFNVISNLQKMAVGYSQQIWSINFTGSKVVSSSRSTSPTKSKNNKGLSPKLSTGTNILPLENSQIILDVSQLSLPPLSQQKISDNGVAVNFREKLRQQK